MKVNKLNVSAVKPMWLPLLFTLTSGIAVGVVLGAIDWAVMVDRSLVKINSQCSGCSHRLDKIEDRVRSLERYGSYRDRNYRDGKK